MDHDTSQLPQHPFPKGFFWGSATAAYQVEGGILNTDWARSGTEGALPVCGRATNHYELFEKDFDLAQSIGNNAHRFSIEWARIEPKEGQFDIKEVEHYKKVLLALRSRGIEPFVTLWHFTLPLWFVEKGGFLHPDAPKLFARYSQYVIEHLGADAHFWITMNEPLVWASAGYLRGKWPPFKKNPFLFLSVLKKLIHAHKEAYNLMKRVRPDIQIGIAKHNIFFSSNKNPLNKIKELISRWFWNYRFLDHINSYQDFIGLNYYFYKKFGGNEKLPKSDMGWDIFPRGIYHCLLELKKYNKPLYVTENGVADAHDNFRSDFIKDSIRNVSQAIQDGAPVKGYFYWSLLDNYEWSFGFNERFGLIEVDYDSFERRVRSSALIYKEIIKNSGVY